MGDHGGHVVRCHSHPCHGFTFGGTLPDHHGFTVLCQPYRAEAVGVIHVCCPVASVIIKGAPCLGLNSDGVVSGHVLCFVAPIIGTGSNGLLASVCHLVNWLSIEDLTYQPQKEMIWFSVRWDDHLLRGKVNCRGGNPLMQTRNQRRNPLFCTLAHH